MHIFDQFYANEEFSLERSLFGQFKHYQNNLHQFEFTKDSKNKCFYIVDINANGYLSDELINNLKYNFSKNKQNILLLNLTIEDFCNQNFYDFLESCNDIITHENTKILTSHSTIDLFKKQFNLNFDCIYYNGCETIFHIWLEKNKEVYVKPNKNRTLKKHFISLNKNARPYRNIFHAFFTKNNLKEKSYYSWHNIGLCESWMPNDGDDLFNILLELELINEPEDVETYLKQPVYLDDVLAQDEWILPHICRDHGAVYCNFDTSYSMDVAYNILKDQKHNSFFTEKTFNPIFCEIPSINLFSTEHHKQFHRLGYKTLDSTYYENLDFSNNKSLLLSQFEMLKSISNMSLNELQEIENSNQVQDIINHNKDHFNTKSAFKNLTKDLELLFDK